MEYNETTGGIQTQFMLPKYLINKEKFTTEIEGLCLSNRQNEVWAINLILMSKKLSSNEINCFCLEKLDVKGCIYVFWHVFYIENTRFYKIE